MREVEYKYLGHKTRGGATSLRPQIRADIFYGGRQKSVYCLIDSGSDHTLINADFADILGIDLSKCRTLTMGGVVDSSIEARVAEVRIAFDGFEDELKIEAKFVRGMTIDVILGQSDFFEEFIIRFEKEKRKFYLARK